MEDIGKVIEYIEKNKLDTRVMVGNEFKTLKACKIASYFKPYIAWYDGNMYMKGKNLIGFDDE